MTPTPSPEALTRERPILFSGPMVRALLAGTKMQTRRAVKLPHMNPLGEWEVFPWGGPNGGRTRDGRTVPLQNVIGHSRTGDIIGCPYGQPGDRLWVRETFYAFGRWETRYSAKKGRDEWHFIDMTLECGKAYAYAADGAPYDFKKGNQRSDRTAAWWKRPAIHMPRVASRIDLDIATVRVERLQDISEADAVAEGIRVSSEARRSDTCYGIYECAMPDGKTHFNDSAYALYRVLWEQINGSGSWDANPWVWAIEFKRITSGALQ